jgi:hypothetical protein
MSQDEIVAKASDLITPVLGAETCTKLIEKVFGLEQVKDIRDPGELDHLASLLGFFGNELSEIRGIGRIPRPGMQP